MSALTLATDIPPAIDTLEKIAFWSILALYDLQRGKTYKEAAGTAIDSGLGALVDVSQITAADGTLRAIARVAFEIDPAHITDTGSKFWQFAQEFSQTAIPAAFKVD